MLLSKKVKIDCKIIFKIYNVDPLIFLILHQIYFIDNTVKVHLIDFHDNIR